MKSWCLAILLCVQTVLVAQAADGRNLAAQPIGRRIALVIGNDSYKGVAPLANARADARAIAQALERAGFKVSLKLDADLGGFKSALRGFKAQVGGGDEAVFYYSGHGVQLGAANYLLPVDIKGDSEEQVKDDAVPLQRVLDDLQEQKARFTLAIIDACRNNPFRQTGRAIGGRGLAPTTAATGQMVLYSAGTGQQALDRLGQGDKNPNGVFTRVLLKEMDKPGVPVNDVLRNVREEVVELAKGVGHEQVPALYDQSLGRFYFRAGDSAQVAVSTPQLAVVRPAAEASASLAPVSPRQAIPLSLPGNVWTVLENSEAFRLTPKAKRVRVEYEMTSDLFNVKAGRREWARLPEPLTFFREQEPVGDKCVASRNWSVDLDGRTTREPDRAGYSCAHLSLGSGKKGASPDARLLAIDELSGSLFPLCVGGESISRSTMALSSSVAYIKATNHCRVNGQRSAGELHPRLKGMAWSIVCRYSATYGDGSKPAEETREDYFLEDLGIYLSDIAVHSVQDGRTTYVLPAPGYRTSSFSPDKSRRWDNEYLRYEWIVGE